MPRAKKIEEVIPQEETMVEPIVSDRTEFDVIGNDGGVIRTYSVEIHGADAEKLANQFAGKIGGTVS